MLNNFFIEEHVKKALEEDIGFGDITTDYLTNEDDTMKCVLIDIAMASVYLCSLIFLLYNVCYVL